MISRAHYILKNSYVWTLCILCIALGAFGLGGCTAAKRSHSSASVKQNSVTRADPGYVQWLEKQAMLKEASELTAIVSGSHIPWRMPYVQPKPESLLEEAPIWLSLHPASILTRNNEPLFTNLQSMEFWKECRNLGIKGLYLAPVRESGGIWGYDVSETKSLGADTVSYIFSKYAGTADDYRRLTAMANKAGAIMADDLVPLDTGLGADFFLAARGKHEYSGVYGLIEIPKAMWDVLPETSSQWKAEAIDDLGLVMLRGKGILPAPLSRNVGSLPLPSYGWAATGEVRGVDGKKRRFAYLYCGTPDRPVLNWNDPSAAAKRIVSGSIIQEVGTLGTALVGIRVSPLLGIEPVEQGGREHGQISLVAEEAAKSMAQEVRRYGGWSFIKDALPLPILREMMQQGPDFAINHASAVSAQVAVLTGDATMLRETVRGMAALGIKQKRLMHGIQPSGGMDISFLHLYGASRGVDAFREQAKMSVTHALTTVGADTLTKDNVVYSTPAGIVAAASGARDLKKLTAVQKQHIRKGMTALALYHAMKPGIFMLSGREVTGTLPLPAGFLPTHSEDAALTQGLMGAYDLTGRAGNVLITPLGMPKAPMLFGSITEQTYDSDSFFNRIHRALLMRNHYRIENSRLLRVMDGSDKGVVIEMYQLEKTGQVMVVAANFGKNAVTELIPEGDLGVEATAKPLDLLDTGGGVVRHSNGLTIELDGWQTRAFVFETPEK